ncbi:FUSC family protein [Algibacter amylolyticus]|uniref:FUSC family protein n=1 Tax=Algibacter amylolyticus TaxID=1608400 RepID=A0A5M7BG65_9FLAO|nr:FUSC family membrane protein [Algibacter amylolyticus]KAA5826225.1 FUSC family protein [Algibacter amylolyticus]MBB5268427.1 putative membrane protein YccC [Algibacter amylolyticus]TSJ80263.1 FUSC family protein [Algibacter amylolyticus]
MIKNLIRYFKSIHFTKAILVALAMVTPVLISIYFFNSFEIGFSIALGAILCAPCDVPGSLKHKFYGILTSVVLVFIITLLIGYFSNTLLIVIPLLIVLVFAVSYLSVFGFRASLISLAGLLSFVLAFAYESSEITVLEHALYLALGGVWYLFLTILTQLSLPQVQTDYLFIELLYKTSEFIKIRGKLLVETNNRNDLLEANFKLQIEINELQETIREVILEKRLNSGFSNRTRRQQLFFSRVMEIYELAISNTIDYDKFDTLFKDHPEKIDEFKVLIFEISDRLAFIAKVVLKEEKLTFNDNFKVLLKKIQNHIDIYKVKVGLPESREGAILLLNFKAYQERQISNLNDIARILENYSKNNKIRGIKDAEQFITQQDYDVKKLKANFSFKSPIFRHSLRLTLTMLIGFLIGYAMEMQQSYWILLTIVVIMRPSYGLTKQRTVQRLVGTLIGAAVGVGIVFLTQNTMVYAVIAALSLIIGFSILKQNYRNGAAFITLYVVFMYALIHPNVLMAIQFRVVDTLIGGVLAYAGNYLFWPAWESKNIKEFFVNSINGIADFLKQIDVLYHEKGEVSTAYKLARKETFLQVANLNAAYQRLVQEPKSKQQNIVVIYDLITICNTYLSSLASLGIYIRTNKTSNVPKQFEIYVTHILSNLEKAVDILEDKESNTHLLNEDLDKATKNYEDDFKSLVSQRGEEIKKGVPISNEMRAQLHETKLIFEQLSWLFNLSESLVKKVKRI